jgi:thioredoxin reductase (NADPH)
MSIRDVIIVGAGPSGLATAIAARHFGLDYVVLEKGALVDAIRRFPINMVFFTTPELLEIGGIPLTTPYEKPTRLEALRYYRNVVDTFQLQISLHEEALSVEREGEIFIVETRTIRGIKRVREARNVVLAMGYYELPNRLDVPGEDLPHVSHFYHEAHPYYRQRVVIVGGKNSSCEAALELHRAGAHVTIVHRGEALSDSVKYWVKPDIENRIKEGSIAARFNARVTEITPTAVTVQSVKGEDRAGWGEPPSSAEARSAKVEGSPEEIPAEGVLLLTGYRADPEFLRRAGVHVNEETLEPKYDAFTYETNVPGLFVAGGQLAGKKTGSVFIENGRFHGEAIAKALAARSRASG